MNLSDLRDHFEKLLKITSLLFHPYLRHKYQPKAENTWVDKLWSLLVYISTWFLVGVVYVFFIYFFIYESEPGKHAHFSDLYHRPMKDILQSVIATVKVSVYFNLAFLVVLYFAIINHAEKSFISGKVLHLDLAGLIKTLTLGRYDQSSRVKEQEENQIDLARKNILEVVKNPAFETLAIMTASGWDFFGEGHPLTNALPQVPASLPKLLTRWEKLKVFFSRKKYGITQNGFLLDIISQRYRKIRIILLDPNAPACNERANDYLNGEHKVIAQVEDYKRAIESVLTNLKLARKKNKNIEVKLVSKTPQWKILLVEGEVWAQPIIPGLRSDHMPLYGFRKSDYSLYHTFWNIHETLWHSSEAVPYKLD